MLIQRRRNNNGFQTRRPNSVLILFTDRTILAIELKWYKTAQLISFTDEDDIILLGFSFCTNVLKSYVDVNLIYYAINLIDAHTRTPSNIMCI